MKVIASSIRKGNIIEREDGHLCVVLSAESFFPGKGTPTTQIDMRRLADGVKVTDRFKTTEQVERAFVEDKEYNYLYSDGDGHHFMNNATYDQVTVPAEVLGEQARAGVFCFCLSCLLTKAAYNIFVLILLKKHLTYLEITKAVYSSLY